MRVGFIVGSVTYRRTFVASLADRQRRASKHSTWKGQYLPDHETYLGLLVSKRIGGGLEGSREGSRGFWKEGGWVITLQNWHLQDQHPWRKTGWDLNNQALGGLICMWRSAPPVFSGSVLDTRELVFGGQTMICVTDLVFRCGCKIPTCVKHPIQRSCPRMKNHLQRP